MKEYGKYYKRTEGPIMITTKKDDTGAIVIVSITQDRTKNTAYNEEEDNFKRRDSDD